MSDWKNALSHLASDVDSHFDRLKNGLVERLYGQDNADAHIVCYRGYGNSSRVIVRGRVFRNYHVNPATEQDTVWRNLLNMYRRFESDEFPHAPLEIHLNGQIIETIASDEGFFYAEIDVKTALPPGEITYTIRLQEMDHAISSTGMIHIPVQDCKRGIISDIDDTVIHTHVTHLIKMAQLTFLGNAFTRLPLAGVAAFYRALQRGTQQSQHPIFYVTNSPWNLHDLLVDFFRIQKIPRGIFFMQDFGFRKGVLLKSERHKQDVIIELLMLYPEMNFVLIGDSGEHDGHTYRDIVRDYPGRILAIYI
ncbi:MAG: App1 family protein, partial [Aggregatilineales bacterium]